MPLLRAHGASRSCRSPNANNRIFWVTDNDDPVKGNTQLIDVLRLKRTVRLVESRSSAGKICHS